MKYTAYIVLAAFISIFAACKDPSAIYEEFRVPNGLTYPGPAMNAIARSGFKEIQIEWQRGSDQSVVGAFIFWNNYLDTVIVDIPAGVNHVSQIIEDLEENLYSFMIHTFDDEGNMSVPVEVMGRVYGDIYLNSLQNRVLLAVEDFFAVVEHELTLRWAPAGETDIGTTLYYTDPDGNPQEKELEPGERITRIYDFDAFKPISYSTTHLPDSTSIAIFTSAKSEFSVETDQTWRNITNMDGMLVNTQKPFTPGDLINVLSNRYRDAIGWKTNEQGGRNGNIDTQTGNVLLLWVWDGVAAAPTITNAKLYQTLNLNSGRYRFDVYSDGVATAGPGESYIVVNFGDDLPNTEDLNPQSEEHRYVRVPDGTTAGTLFSLEFSLSPAGEVSLGFVANLTSRQQVLFQSVELWAWR